MSVNLIQNSTVKKGCLILKKTGNGVFDAIDIFPVNLTDLSLHTTHTHLLGLNAEFAVCKIRIRNDLFAIRKQKLFHLDHSDDVIATPATVIINTPRM